MKRIILALAASLGLVPATQAQEVILKIALYGLYSDEGVTPLPSGNMLQLVDLGANGIFDPVLPGSWVSGDDALVFESYQDAFDVTEPGEFPSTAALDTWTGPNGPDGTSELVLPFHHLASGRFGVRWWAAYTPADFYAAATPEAGDVYGQFTRQDFSLHGGTLWWVPGNGDIEFDALGTESWGGLDPESAGFAAWTVAVPEPAYAAGLMAFVAVLRAFARRRAS